MNATDEHSPNLDANTAMAVTRTRVAAERTMMAWVRTSLSMISFGFSLYKFFQYLREAQKGNAPFPVHGPRTFGVLLIGLGLLALALGIWQHVQLLRGLPGGAAALRRSAALYVALALAAIGAFAFISTLLRVGPF